MRNEIKQPQKIFNWLRAGESYFFWFFIGTLMTLLVLFIFWAIVNLYWKQEGKLRVTTPSGEAYVSIPKMIPANGDHVFMSLSLADSNSFSMPVKISVTLPDRVNYPVRPGRRLVEQVFHTQYAAPVEVPLQNDQTHWTGQTSTITVTVMGSVPSQREVFPVEVFVEGKNREAVREFVNEASNFFSVTTIAAVLTGLFTLWSKLSDQIMTKDREEKEEAEKRQQARQAKAKEKKEEAKKLKYERQIHIKDKIVGFRNALVANQLEEANHALNEIMSLEVQDEFGNEIKTMEALAQISKGIVTLDNLASTIEVSRVWRREFCAAILIGYENLSVLDPLLLRSIIPQLSVENLSQELCDKMKTIQENEKDIPGFKFPGVRINPPYSPSLSFLLSSQSRNSFAFCRAEDEEYWLFHDPVMFWNQLYPFPQLHADKNPSTMIITGGQGNGKTTLALGLSRYLINQDIFSVYLPEVNDFKKLQIYTSQALLHVVQENPVHLGQLSGAEIYALANFLSMGLEKDYLVAEVAETRRSLLRQTWLQEEGLIAEEEKRRRRFWRQSAEGYLHELERKLINSHAISSDEFSYQGIACCLRSFGFSTVRLVFDLNNWQDHPAFLDQVIRNSPLWIQQGIQIFVFLPVLDTQRFERALVRVYKIEWNRENLIQMLNYRCHTLIGPETSLHSLFQKDALNEVVEYALDGLGAPRRFSRLGNHIVSKLDRNTSIITLEMVQRSIAAIDE